MYALETSIPAYDHVHPVSATDTASVRRLMMGHVEYIRFALHVASGVYVPYEVSPKHEGLRTMAVRFR